LADVIDKVIARLQAIKDSYQAILRLDLENRVHEDALL